MSLKSFIGGLIKRGQVMVSQPPPPDPVDPAVADIQDDGFQVVTIEPKSDELHEFLGDLGDPFAPTQDPNEPVLRGSYEDRFRRNQRW